MASISSLGVGSGLDLQTLVDGLVAAERDVRLGRLATREAIATERISAYGLLKSSVSLFNGALSTLSDIGTFQARSSSNSNEEAFSISVDANASLGSYQVEVVNAGAAQVLSGSSFVDVTGTAITSADTAIGGGSLSIQQGGQPSFAVVISSASSSLNDIAAAINEAEGNTGVQAAVINADSGPVLVINATETGLDNEIVISVDDIAGDDTDALGLSQLSFNVSDPSVSNLVQTTGADNAAITVNGLAVTSASGQTFADVVSGVSITTIAATTEAGTISVSQNTQQAVDAVSEFVEAFNGLSQSLTDLGRAGGEGGESSGALVGDSLVRNLTSQLRRTIFSSIDETQPEGVQTLSDIGLSISRDGELSLDGTKFNSLLASNFDDVARLLAANGDPIDQNQQFRTADFDTFTTAVGEGSLDITVGEDSFSIAISAGAGNNTVQGIRDAINAATDNAGVAASIVLVDDGAGGTNAQLLLTSALSGAAGELTVAVTDNDGNDTDALGLSQLAGLNLSEIVSTTLDAPLGVIGRLESLVAGYLGGNGETGIIDSRTTVLNSDIDRVSNEREVAIRRLLSFEDRLKAQFSSLDLLVSNLQSNGQFLLSQLNATPLANRSDN